MGNYMEIDGDVKWFVSKERGGGNSICSLFHDIKEEFGLEIVESWCIR